MTSILLVEDNENNRDMLTRRLQKKGFDILTAIDGKQGVEKAESDRPDLILMDMGLPILDGWEATRQIKSNKKTREIPIIGLSAHAMSGDRKKAIDAGCCDYDTKPVNLERLLKIINRNIVVDQLHEPKLSTKNKINFKNKSKKIVILVVDDDLSCLKLIERFLENEDCEIILASNGIDAWEFLESGQYEFDVAILDRQMPGMDGIQILQRMKKHDGLKEIPVIFQSGLIDVDDIRTGMQEGAYYYLTKPYVRRSLISIVEAAISESYRKQQLIEDIHNSSSEIAATASSNGHVVFKTLDEISNIACTLAAYCPEPEKIVVGLSELLINAVEHGNLGISYDEKQKLIMDNLWLDEIKNRLSLSEYSDKNVNVFWEKDDNEIRFIIKDEGKGFIPDKYLELDPNRATHPHGRGIAMARMMSFSNISFIGCGNQVIVTIALN